MNYDNNSIPEFPLSLITGELMAIQSTHDGLLYGQVKSVEGTIFYGLMRDVVRVGQTVSITVCPNSKP